MTFPLGRFGDSRVIPDELFDVNDPAARPPRDAIDVQFRTPVTLNTMLHMMVDTGNADMVDDWRRMYLEIAEGTKLFVQRNACGVDVERSGLAPARLAVTAVMHGQVAGFEFPRWHLHVYVGATATSLLDGGTIPVHVDSLRRSMDGVAYPYYAGKVEELTNQEWGLQWGCPDGWELREIVEPDIARVVDSRVRGVCTQPELTDVAEVIFPDALELEFAARDEAVTARARAEGRPDPGQYTRAKLMYEGADIPHS